MFIKNSKNSEINKDSILNYRYTEKRTLQEPPLLFCHIYVVKNSEKYKKFSKIRKYSLKIHNIPKSRNKQKFNIAFLMKK
jgi:hypothetical protein